VDVTADLIDSQTLKPNSFSSLCGLTKQAAEKVCAEQERNTSGAKESENPVSSELKSLRDFTAEPGRISRGL
jgi:hypothetical protein